MEEEDDDDDELNVRCRVGTGVCRHLTRDQPSFVYQNSRVNK